MICITHDTIIVAGAKCRTCRNAHVKSGMQCPISRVSTMGLDSCWGRYKAFIPSQKYSTEHFTFLFVTHTIITVITQHMLPENIEMGIQMGYFISTSCRQKKHVRPDWELNPIPSGKHKASHPHFAGTLHGYCARLSDVDFGDTMDHCSPSNHIRNAAARLVHPAFNVTFATMLDWMD
jgi:hypothetical protein